jgi:hypothetical protein
MPLSKTILVVLFLVVPVLSASAYVDPGTGSMVIQAVVAALVGAGAIVGAFWRRIFRRRKATDDDEDGTGPGGA